MRDIYWAQLCGNKSDADAFWSENLTVNTNNPDLTRCFQNTVLTWIPCGYLMVVTLPYLLYLRTFPSMVRQPFSILNVAKLATCVLLAVLNTVLLASRILKTGGSSTDLYLSSSLQIISYIVSAILLRLEYRKGFHTSCVLFFFYSLELFIAIIFCRSAGMQWNHEMYSMDSIEVWVLFALSGFTAVAFGLNVPADQKAKMSQYSTQHSCNTIDETTPLLRSNDNTSIQENMFEEVTSNVPLESPEESASFLNKILYCWALKFVILFKKKVITFDDIYDIPRHAKISTNIWRFQARWLPLAVQYRKEQTHGQISRQPSLIGALCRSLWGPLLLAVIIRLVAMGFQFSSPLLLRLLLQHIQSGSPYVWKGVGIAFLMVFASVIQSLLFNSFRFSVWNTGLRTKTTLIAQVYRKALRLSVGAKRETSAGQVNNLISTDCSRFLQFPLQCAVTVVTLLQVVISVFLLWDSMNIAVLGGILLLVGILPLNGFFVARFMRRMQLNQMAEKDLRLKESTQLLNGIKVLKLYAWEKAFLDKVFNVRRKELGILKKLALVNALNTPIWSLGGTLAGFIIYAVYILSSSKNILTPDAAFVTASLVNIFNRPLTGIPQNITDISKALAALQRIRHFLLLEEISEDTVSHGMTKDNAVEIGNGYFTWEDSENPTLRAIDLSIKKGALVAVVGRVGQGKSSLLSAILGDMGILKGTVNREESIAFVPQMSWIRNQTIRDNILMFKPYNPSLYRDVINGCALEQDLAILPSGDKAEIGEKGINLSGGQKQRISLARAVYQDKDTYLLDDPLSAVDSHVSKHLFDKIIGPRGMLRHKTRVLVTHAVNYLPQMDFIYVIEDGQITTQGTFRQLIDKNGAFAESLQTPTRDEGQRICQDDICLSSENELMRSSEQGSSTYEELLRKRSVRNVKTSTVAKSSDQKCLNNGRLITEETVEIGALQRNLIHYLIKSAGYVAAICVMLFEAIYLVFLVLGNIWLSVWTDDNIAPNTTSPVHNRSRLAFYGGIIGVQLVTLVSAFVSLAIGGLILSRTLHSRLLDRLVHAPMSYFDTTPLGRILNRLSADMDSVDTIIPKTIASWFFDFVPLAATVILLTYGTYLFLVICVPLVIFYIVVQRIYVKVYRQLKLIDAVRRSPLYIHFQETLDGAQSIRAYGLTQQFTALGDRFVDDSQRAMYMYLMIQRLLAIILECTAASIVLCAALFAVLLKEQISVGVAGMMVSYTLQMSRYMAFYVRSSSELESQMVAVERIKEISEVEQEAPWSIEHNKPPIDWPVDGAVEFVGYSTRYRPGLDLVLRDINCIINPGEKVGVVGRTGAGKSSLLLSLFRLIEPAGGSIYIDGINTRDLGLNDLRSHLTIIPQDPLVFSGSLKSNLDPFSQYTEDELWSSLEYAHLKSFVVALPQRLEHECGENGEALSVGTRQLLCLARALLRKSRILVLDEATAAVDITTDRLIQQMIREAFTESTIITIAHRINTILDYDRVMVMDAGRIAEFDSPTALLKNKSSLFYSLFNDAGIM